MWRGGSGGISGMGAGSRACGRGVIEYNKRIEEGRAFTWRCEHTGALITIRLDRDTGGARAEMSKILGG